jgi:hypothetical protein
MLVSIRDAIRSGDPAACATQLGDTGDGQPVDAGWPARFRYVPFRSPARPGSGVLRRTLKWPVVLWIRLRCIVFLPLGLVAACSSTPPAPQQPPAAPAAANINGTDAEPPSRSERMLETARTSVRSSAVWLARGVDSWFGDRPFEEGGKVSDGRLSVELQHREDEGANLSVRFNARFRLPNVEKQTYLFVGRDDERDVITDTPGALSRQDRLLAPEREEQAFFAGLGRTISDYVDFRVGLRGGLKVYAQARYRRLWHLTPIDLVDFRETVFWTVADGLGSTTAFTYEHALTPTLAARWLSAATITQDTGNFAWSSILGGYKSFGNQRLLALEGIVEGEQGSGVGFTDYGLRARWQQPVHKDWLIGDVIVGHFWPRPNALSERGRAWAFGASLQMRF